MKKLTDEALVRAFIDTLGVGGATLALGWALASAIGAPPDADRRWYRAHGIGGQTTRYREALLEAGYDLTPETATRPLVQALAGAGRAWH